MSDVAKKVQAVPVFNKRLSECRKARNSQSGDYSRLRWAANRGIIHRAELTRSGRREIWLNSEEADGYLASLQSQDSVDSELPLATECRSADVARLVAAIEDMAVAIRQALAAISQKV